MSTAPLVESAMYCGVDEAGRGSVMGPLVVGAVYVESDDALAEIGVKDSKQLTARMRERMYDQIADAAEHWCTVALSSEEIDSKRNWMSLNRIELEMFGEATSKWHATEVYADCPDIKEEKFGMRLKVLVGEDVEVIAKHKADDTYLVVSAASIMAKVTRDRMMDDLRAEFDVDIGSGYPSDHYTMDFIQDWIDRTGKVPPHVRKSWEPVRDMLAKNKMTTLDDW